MVGLRRKIRRGARISAANKAVLSTTALTRTQKVKKKKKKKKYIHVLRERERAAGQKEASVAKNE